MRVLCLVPLLLALSLAAQDAVVATVAKRGNVRYGPSKDAAVAVTLGSDAKVEILGRITKPDGTWYQIRFPREGKAWMHEKILKKLEDGSFEVTEDKARVRDDATLGANIVAELAKGDVVEDRGQKVGQWHAIYPPKAVAYVHEIVLDLPKADAVGSPVAQAPAGDPVRTIESREGLAERTWTVARETFTRYAAVNNLQQALTLDWPGLSAQLALVAESHPKMGARLEAQRYKDGVDAVVKEQQRLGAKPTQAVPEPAAAPMVQAQPPVQQPPVQQPPVQQPTPTEQPQQPTQGPTEQPVVDSTPTAAPSLEVQQLMGPDQAARVQASVGAFAAEGFLEQRGADYIVVDNKSQVVAYLKPNGAVQLSDYFWRQIGVKGAIQNTVDVAGVSVPVILVDDVILIQR